MGPGPARGHFRTMRRQCQRSSCAIWSKTAVTASISAGDQAPPHHQVIAIEPERQGLPVQDLLADENPPPPGPTPRPWAACATACADGHPATGAWPRSPRCDDLPPRRPPAGTGPAPPQESGVALGAGLARPVLYLSGGIHGLDRARGAASTARRKARVLPRARRPGFRADGRRCRHARRRLRASAARPAPAANAPVSGSQRRAVGCAAGGRGRVGCSRRRAIATGSRVGSSAAKSRYSKR